MALLLELSHSGLSAFQTHLEQLQTLLPIPHSKHNKTTTTMDGEMRPLDEEFGMCIFNTVESDFVSRDTKVQASTSSTGAAIHD
jgi:hypothetical protein